MTVPKGFKPSNSNKTILVDDDVYEQIKHHKWHVTNKGYAAARVLDNIVYLHKIPMLSLDKQIDHINGDRLDCRKENLRFASNSQNQANRMKSSGKSSIHKGVCYHKKAGRWMAHIKKNQKFIYIGLYNNEEDAAKAYNENAIALFGDYARLNKV